MQMPTFDEWFEAKYHKSFDDLYCHGRLHISEVLIQHINHSREYMQEQLQAVADQKASEQ